MNIGVIGCGNISSVYLDSPRTFAILDIRACADLDRNRAQAQAQRHGIPKACSVKELLADPEIDVVINLTTPSVHAEISLAAIEAGKSVYSEKPLALNREQGRTLLDAAQQRDLRVGCAPDTFLGGGIQTCIALVNDGQIGKPIAATACMMCRGHERWHPDPEFFYQPGAGPMFDMGPYYLTALIAMMGPVHRVTSMTKITFPERIITSQPRYGKKFSVHTPTYVAGIMEFRSDAIVTLVTSFDVWSHHLPHIEIYGSEGTLRLSDPNTFGGPVYLRRARESEWKEVTLSHGYTQNMRGIGLADMAYAMRSGYPHRANGTMAYHVLDIMEAFYESDAKGRHIELSSTCDRPTPLSSDLLNWGG